MYHSLFLPIFSDYLAYMDVGLVVILGWLRGELYDLWNYGRSQQDIAPDGEV